MACIAADLPFGPTAKRALFVDSSYFIFRGLRSGSVYGWLQIPVQVRATVCPRSCLIIGKMFPFILLVLVSPYSTSHASFSNTVHSEPDPKERPERP
jgi:hypothetical protein